MGSLGEWFSPSCPRETWRRISCSSGLYSELLLLLLGTACVCVFACVRVCLCVYSCACMHACILCVLIRICLFITLLLFLVVCVDIFCTGFQCSGLYVS